MITARRLARNLAFKPIDRRSDRLSVLAATGRLRGVKTAWKFTLSLQRATAARDTDLHFPLGMTDNRFKR